MQEFERERTNNILKQNRGKNSTEETSTIK